MDFGLFFSTNYGNHSVERDFVAAFVSDVLLGSEPWITAEKTCEIFENGFNVTLPEPDFAQCPCDTGDIETLSEWLKMLPKASPLYDWMKSECLWRFRQNISLKELPAQQLEIYEGEYGHFGYGNFTIFINDTTQMLEMQYGGLGRFDLYPTEQEHFFLGQGKENAIALYAWPVLFSESVPGSGFIDLARVTEMENQIFERGLLMDEAPPPRIQDCS